MDKKITEARLITFTVSERAWAGDQAWAGVSHIETAAEDFHEYLNADAIMGLLDAGALERTKTEITVTTVPSVFARDDEASFRAAVPYKINSLVILEVSGYRPGDGVGYPSAIAVWRRQYREQIEYGTHRLVYQDDRQSGPGFVLEEGHYEFTTRAKADADAAKRKAER